MTRFFLIRHATTPAIGKWLSGRTNGVHLNETGLVQAQLLAQYFAGISLGAIYSSPLDRAIETATPLAAQQHLTVMPNEAFNELDFGEWTNLPFDELNQSSNFQLFNSFRSVTRIPGGESMQEAQLRFTAALHLLVKAHKNESIAIVSHADLVKSAIAFYAGIPLDLFQRIEISPASCSIIELDATTIRIVCVNASGNLPFYG